MVKPQGTIIGSNVALPAKQVCGLYYAIASPACTARHKHTLAPLSSASVSEAPFKSAQLIQTGVDQAHEQIAHSGTVQRLVKEGVFATMETFP